MKLLVKITLIITQILFLASCKKSSVDPQSILPGHINKPHILDAGLPAKDYSYPSSAYDLTDALPEGYVTDASVDYTTILQKAIDAHSTIVFPDFPILISKPGLRIRTDKSVYFQENSQLKMDATMSGQYYMILVLDAENVLLKNLNLEGDRNRHLGTTGEWGMGIYVSGSKNVKIEAATIKNCWGDGILLTKDGWNKPSENVHILNCLIDSSRRSGITIGSGIDILIENTIMQNSHGPLISSGFTVEPNDRTHDIDNVVLKNCITRNNERVGIRLVTTNFYGSGGSLKDNNMSFINHKDDASQFAITLVMGSKRKSGGINPSDIIFKNFLMVDNRNNAVADYTEDGSEVLYNVFFEDVYSIKDGQINTTQMAKLDALIEKKSYLHGGDE